MTKIWIKDFFLNFYLNYNIYNPYKHGIISKSDGKYENNIITRIGRLLAAPPDKINLIKD